MKLSLGSYYNRQQVHSIFAPDSAFTPQAGTWGLQGIIRVPDRPGDWVFFVTFGQQQGDHAFDESITEDGVLSWQSQPNQKLGDKTIRELIAHDDRLNSIYLFLRTKKGADYCYLGRLGYLTHDEAREKPVYFQWQLLDWPIEVSTLNQAGVRLVRTMAEPDIQITAQSDELLFVEIPVRPPTSGVTTRDFKQRKQPDYAAREKANRELGLSGELLVIKIEKDRLVKAGRADLAEKVIHVAKNEGDGAGYDIRSYWEDERVRYIEVKTTRGGANTSFYVSPNEVVFSEVHADSYTLFRLYEFDAKLNSAKCFVLDGPVRDHADITPTEYRVTLKPPPNEQ